MTNLTIYSQTLTASTEERTITGLLLPFNEQGATSAGRVTASETSVTVPEDVSQVVLNIEHDGLRPVGRATSIEAREDGLHASFRIAKTGPGNDLLEEVREGLRACLSVEVDSPVIRNGALIAGDLTGAGAVVRPAFPSASVYSLAASDCGDLDPSGDAASVSTAIDPVSESPEALSASSPSEAPADDISTDMENTVENATVASELLASKSNAVASKPEDMTKGELISLIAGAHSTGRPESLTAALTNVTESVFDPARQPAYLGELWDGRSQPTFYTGLVTHQALTARKAVGYRYTTKPGISTWSGFPNEIPSGGPLAMEAIEVTSDRLACGANFDRSLIDFGESAFIDAYFRFCTDDYVLKTDQRVLDSINSAATAVTGVEAAPTGVDTASFLIVKGSLNLLSKNVIPTFAIVGADLYEKFLLTPKDKTLEYFAAAAGLEGSGLAGLTVVPSNHADNLGKVVVGAKQAITLFELPGSPIRVDALDIAHGGVTGGLYAYQAVLDLGKGVVSMEAGV